MYFLHSCDTLLKNMPRPSILIRDHQHKEYILPPIPHSTTNTRIYLGVWHTTKVSVEASGALGSHKDLMRVILLLQLLNNRSVLSLHVSPDPSGAAG